MTHQPTAANLGTSRRCGAERAPCGPNMQHPHTLMMSVCSFHRTQGIVPYVDACMRV